jgi:hypothetical protein
MLTCVVSEKVSDMIPLALGVVVALAGKQFICFQVT